MARYDAPSRGSGKQNTFFGGAAILAVGILVVKLIGMFYKIPLVNIIGAQGNTDFTNAYNIYAVLLTISTAGLPVAVSKLVSEANALGRRNQVKRTFRLSLLLFLGLGLVSFLVMFFKADMLAGMMHDSKAAPGIQALAPAVVCVGCLAALRGYTQGHLNMTPTSISQIIEALCKLTIGLALMLNELRAVRFKRISQSLLYLPHFISWVVVAGIAQNMFNMSNGTVNKVLEGIGVGPIPFLSHNGWWIFTYILCNIWKEIGWGTIIYLAALTSVDESLYEAAYLDGATRLQRIRYIMVHRSI